MEHRWGQRIAVSIPVRLVCRPHGTGDGRITDISLSGARIRTDLELPRLALVEMIVESSDAVRSGCCHGPDTRLAAYIVRRGMRELGVEWNPVANGEAMGLLRTAIAHHEPPLESMSNR
jgi:hypothetical protein